MLEVLEVARLFTVSLVFVGSLVVIPWRRAHDDFFHWNYYGRD